MSSNTPNEIINNAMIQKSVRDKITNRDKTHNIINLAADIGDGGKDLVDICYITDFNINNVVNETHE